MISRLYVYLSQFCFSIQSEVFYVFVVLELDSLSVSKYKGKSAIVFTL